MILYLFLSMVMAFSVAAAARWRAGIWLVILVGALQDPVRKMVPGAPGYLAMSTFPVWAGLLFGAARTGDLAWWRFKRLLPGPARLFTLLIVLLLPGLVMSLTYAPGSWQVALLGLVSYGAVMAAFLAGIHFPRRDGDIEKVLFWFVVVNAVLLAGAPLERMGLGVESGILGTSKLGSFWVTYRTGNVIKMFSGFYRSPDIMGWHAATVSMMAILLATRLTGWRRILLIALAAWGGVGVMLCARRKMISAVIVFVVLLFVLLVRYGKVRRILNVGMVLLVGIVFALQVYRSVGPDRGIEVFYGTIHDEAVDRVYKHGFSSVLVTIRQAGFFGYGLGMAVQGAHHLDVERPNIWQESALDKLVAEIGVPGLAAFLLLIAGLFLAGHRLLLRIGPLPGSETYFGLAALLLANILASVVSSQIYGDPYVGTLLAFFAGVFFSCTRLVMPGRAGPPPTRPPAPQEHA